MDIKTAFGQVADNAYLAEGEAFNQHWDRASAFALISIAHSLMILVADKIE